MGDKTDKKSGRGKLNRTAKDVQSIIKDKDSGWVSDGWLYPYFLQDKYRLFREIEGDCQISGYCDINFRQLEKLLGMERHAASKRYDELIKLGLIHDFEDNKHQHMATVNESGVAALNELLKHVNKYGAWELSIYTRKMDIRKIDFSIIEKISESGKRKKYKNKKSQNG